ncbi:MAG TPA: hypothetical protein VF933_26980 [Streptosporangiaceae bacterium]
MTAASRRAGIPARAAARARRAGTGTRRARAPRWNAVVWPRARAADQVPRASPAPVTASSAAAGSGLG